MDSTNKLSQMKKIFLSLGVVLIMFGCGADQSIGPDFNGGPVSQGGSTAKFTISGNYLYAIDNINLTTFDISDEKEIILLHKLTLNTIQLETIFPYGDELYLGSTTGVLIVSIATPSRPEFLSEYQHVLSCDPVVTDGAYAYVTLRSGNNCGQVDDELQVIDLADIMNPQIVARHALESPRGLALNGEILYVCDAGIKAFDVSDLNDIKLVSQISGIPANDVLYYNNQILVTADNGFYQYNVTDKTNFTEIGHFAY
jgi:hypothetical protein